MYPSGRPVGTCSAIGDSGGIRIHIRRTPIERRGQSQSAAFPGFFVLPFALLGSGGARRYLRAFADVGDFLTAEPADRLSLTVVGPFAGALQGFNRFDDSEHFSFGSDDADR